MTFEMHDHRPTMQIRAGNHIAECIKVIPQRTDIHIPLQDVTNLIECCQALVDNLSYGTSNFSEDIADALRKISEAADAGVQSDPRDIRRTFDDVLPKINTCIQDESRRPTIATELMKIAKTLLTVVDIKMTDNDFRHIMSRICIACERIKNYESSEFPDVP